MQVLLQNASRKALGSARRPGLASASVALTTVRKVLASVSACMCLFALASTAAVHAQDTRKVHEPTIPAPCFVLRARLAAPRGVLALEDETRLDTDRIQKAINTCPAGRAVMLGSSNTLDAFLTGPLEMHKGVTLLIDKGVTLYASRDPRLYELRPGSCGIVDHEAKSGCLPLIRNKRAHDAAIMGEGTIDGRGGSTLLAEQASDVPSMPAATFNHAAGFVAAPASVPAYTLVEQEKSWWDLAEDARNKGRQEVFRLIDTDHADNFILYKITLKNSPNVHVGFHHGNGLTVWGVRIDTPKISRNTDGIDPSSSRNITITHSFIRAGDDNIALKAGNGPIKDVSVLHNHFYWGHGMSIGSETNGGVSNVLVEDLSLDGPDNGLRIKSNPSRGGMVKDVTFENICIRNSKAPILFETAYNIPGDTKTKEPVYRDILLKDVRVSGGGKLQILGLDDAHRISVRFDGVMLADPNGKYKFMAKHSDIALGPGPVNFQLAGDDAQVSGTLSTGELPGCEAMFVPYPTD